MQRAGAELSSWSLGTLRRVARRHFQIIPLSICPNCGGRCVLFVRLAAARYPLCGGSSKRMPLRARYIFPILALAAYAWHPARAQAPPAKKTPQVLTAPAAPNAPQSKHFPILLLASGNNPAWSLRIGQKGPERLDRPGYPPIALEPAEVDHDPSG